VLNEAEVVMEPFRPDPIRESAKAGPPPRLQECYVSAAGYGDRFTVRLGLQRPQMAPNEAGISLMHKDIVEYAGAVAAIADERF
jgi:hypothetical protein